MSRTKQEERNETEALKKRQEINTENFWTTILKILKKDWSQTCIKAPGTKIRLESDGNRDTIIIETGISSSTLQKLTETKYLVSCEGNTGKLQIENIVLRRDEQ